MDCKGGGRKKKEGKKGGEEKREERREKERKFEKKEGKGCSSNSASGEILLQAIMYPNIFKKHRNVKTRVSKKGKYGYEGRQFDPRFDQKYPDSNRRSCSVLDRCTQ